MSYQELGMKTFKLSCGAALLLAASVPVSAHRLEKHFTVQGRPIVTVNAMASGRIEVKSWKNPEVVVIGNHASKKVEIDSEQAENRIEILTNVVDKSATQSELETNFDITVPEETELQMRTEAGTIYVEHVYGDMTFETVSGDVHLKETSGYVIVKTVGGSVLCLQCAGKLNFTSISGNIQVLQPQLSNLSVSTTSGNILYDGQFLTHGIYRMKTGTGWLEVRFSDTDSFDLRATTDHGTVDNQARAFLKPDAHDLRYMPRWARGILGSVNAGLAHVELSSFSGTIRIRKRD
jgi:DUF4097 and DUF4098 domain-containing protein YvlB